MTYDPGEPSRAATEAVKEIVSRGIPRPLVTAVTQASFEDGIRAGMHSMARMVPVIALIGGLVGVALTYLAMR